MLELTRASDGGDFCPPRGAVRSSLVPRDLTAEFVFDCPRFARASPCMGHLTVCLCLFVHIYATRLCHSLRSGAFTIVIRLMAFGLVAVGRRSCPLSFAVVFSVVESLYRFSALGSVVFVGDIFVLLAWVHPLRGRVRDFIGSGRTCRKFSWNLGNARSLNA